jgi:hypothetical protein
VPRTTCGKGTKLIKSHAIGLSYIGGRSLAFAAMASIIHLVSRKPGALTGALSHAGHSVWEAATLAEVLALLRQHPNMDLILVDADVKDGRDRAAAFGRIAIVIDRGETAQQVLQQIALLSPPGKRR